MIVCSCERMSAKNGRTIFQHNDNENCDERLIIRVRDFFFFQAEDGIRDTSVTGVQTCALPILCILLLVQI